MTNLSELLPSGGGQNAVEFTATGTLSNGAIVGLKSDGTVAVLDPSSVGSPADFPSSFSVQLAAACYDSIRNVVHVAYKDLGTQYVTHSAGSISGSTITWGTKTTVSTESPKRIDIAFMESIQFPIVAYCMSSNPQDFKVRSGSGGSGTTMNWNGNLHTVQSGQSRDCYIAYNPNNSDASSAETLVLYTYEPNGYVYMAALETTNNASTSTRLGVTSLAYYSGDQMDTVGLVKVGTGNSFLAVLNRNNYSTNNTGSYAYQIAISSTQLNFSTGAVIGTGYGASGTNVDQALTSNTGRMANDGSSYYGVITGSFKEGSGGAQSLRAYVITANGTGSAPTITGPVDMIPGVTANLFYGTTTVYDSSASKYVTVFGYGNNSYYGYILTSTLSGTTFTVDAGATSLQSQNIYYDAITAAYSEHSNNTVIASQQNPPSNFRGVTFTAGSLCIDKVIGITAQAISKGATGTVNLLGGINESQSNLTPGTDYYIDASTGQITATSLGNTFIGTAVSATTLNIKDL